MAIIVPAIPRGTGTKEKTISAISANSNIPRNNSNMPIFESLLT
ncbi:MAG: hypothetical protein UT61_C0024G0006 [Candidatus Woesebacteria bacterium GW2011_GWA1_39_8]|uniref:Uncharacterized protein n=1 Tax=Candidatus Woesebacteria bacterium GW2011_GWA1_39_8 TaxID=1618552 RepID=A0A0G0PNE9_9BACT|nr:MAG: hypothetical protein UT61_C0024G0006 [Candidatus Woesebacteria bacterium GW2011_GWA1_39_8]